ncbi:hypothetical protein BRC2024_HCTLARHO_CDS_0050 [Acinetobacter phage vB_AbaS_Silvergun]
MNYRLTIVGGRNITAFCAVAPVHKQWSCDNSLPRQQP